METRIDFLSWLSKKLYLINVGVYVTICTVMILTSLFVAHLDMPPLLANFAAFFIVIFLRAAYESMIIYEASFKYLSLHEMLILSFVTSSAMSLVLLFLKPRLGHIAIPVAIIIAMIIVGKLKAALWGTTERPGFFHELPAKLALSRFSMYGFYVFLVGISYLAVAKYNFDFNYAFAAAFFIGMMFEEYYNFSRLYDQKLTAKPLVAMIIWSATCAIASSSIIWVMIGKFGYAGQAATIISVILLKLIQPLGSRKFILGL